LASLHHPNVASIFGIDQEEDVCFLALELVPGASSPPRTARAGVAVTGMWDGLCAVFETPLHGVP